MLDYLSTENKLELIQQQKLYQHIKARKLEHSLDKGREGLIRPRPQNPFTQKWFNPLSVVFSFMALPETLEY